MEKAGIFDIDEVFCQTEFIFDEVAKLGLEGEDKWDYFHANIERCKPNQWCISMIKSLIPTHKIIFITARDEQIREKTHNYLAQHLGTDSFLLFMSDYTIRRPHYLAKREVVQHLKKEHDLDIEFAIDDDSQNCLMYLEQGINVLKAL